MIDSHFPLAHFLPWNTSTTWLASGRFLKPSRIGTPLISQPFLWNCHMVPQLCNAFTGLLQFGISCDTWCRNFGDINNLGRQTNDYESTLNQIFDLLEYHTHLLFLLLVMIPIFVIHLALQQLPPWLAALWRFLVRPQLCRCQILHDSESDLVTMHTDGQGRHARTPIHSFSSGE